ncbi:complement C1q tumor necrosis factor-related protein 3-like isoform X2 [Stegastes partitus]|uniref:Complement C1q tumor necrosis factor-related protein 3-like isoform X2 n=1 Tax=Stegastes partitus TaxID=144197 RepID=A0A9Y4TW69_9TELE|nr:PREDICTED: complement C1q tumor necrosis factor-related protein 3-like isoform X2 [Stegastes partitus]
MDFTALRLLILLGFMHVEPGFGQRDDMDFSEWMTANQKYIKNLVLNLTNAEQCRSDVEALDARLNATVDELTRQKAEIDNLKTENEDLKARLNATENEIGQLKKSSGKAAPQIAFSASLANSGEIYNGPSTDKTLVFKRVFSNIGSGYDANSGVFTAPVNGFYYFSFSTYGYNTHTMGAILIKNDVRQISTYDSPTSDGSDSSSNAAVLQLAAGDNVHMELWDDGRVYDNLNGHTTFSGFLLFPL